MWLLLLLVPLIYGHPFRISTTMHPIHPRPSDYQVPALEASHAPNATGYTDYYWDARNFPRAPNTTDRDLCGMSSVPADTTNTVCNPDAVISAQNGGCEVIKFLFIYLLVCSTFRGWQVYVNFEMRKCC